MSDNLLQLDEKRMRSIAKARVAIDICVSRARKAMNNNDAHTAEKYLNMADIAVSAQQGQINWCVDGDSDRTIAEAKRDYDLD